MFSQMFNHCSVSFYNLRTLSKDHPENTMPEMAKWIPYLRVEHLKNHTHSAWKIGNVPPPWGTGHLKQI